MKLTIIIVSYNVRGFLAQCLRSIEKASEGLDVETFVVDNNSSDDTAEYIHEHFPWVRFMQNSDNVGFAKANNRAIRESESDYVLLLNPDTFIGENVLNQLIAFMDSHPEAGAAGVEMIGADGRFARESRRGVPTPFTSFCKMSGLARIFPSSHTLGHYYMSYLPQDEANQIEIISGACMCLRRKALTQVGLLDETFFMYGEDIDLSYRILKAGWQNWYIPVTILHYKGESTKKNQFRYINAFYTAMVIFMNKHFSSYSFWFTWLMKLAVYVKGGIDFIYQNLKVLTDFHKDDYYLSRAQYAEFDTEKMSYEDILREMKQIGLTNKKTTIRLI